MYSYNCQPYIDESTYSLLSRVHVQSGERSPFSTLKYLTGLRGFKPISGLPTHVSTLVKSFDIKGGVKALIKLHTHLPLYSHFITPERQIFIMQAMEYDGFPKSRLGLLRADVQAKETLRYCHDCYENDIRSHGVAYWHREHSLPGVTVCHHHDSYLSEVEVSGTYGDRLLLLPGNGGINLEIENKEAKSRLKFISDQLYVLLRNSPSVLFCPSVYRQIVGELGLETKQAHVRQRNLTKLVKDWLYPMHKINIYQKMIQALKVDRNWVAQLVSGRSGFHHPLKHIALWGALGIDERDVRNTSQPFGQQLEFDFNMAQASNISKEKLSETLAKYRTLTLASHHLNVCITTLSVLADIYGLEYRRRPKKITKETKKEIYIGYKAGKKTTELAAKSGLSIGSVNRIIRVLRKQ